MVRITAKTLEEAYATAARELSCSVTELDIEILQAPSRGIFGLFAKDAIIKAVRKGAEEKRGKRARYTSIENPVEREIILKEIEEGIRNLLRESCFDIALKELRFEDDTVYIHLDGPDAALLIGKEGYRYKAISYMLHNWIKIKYDLGISLEIAEFLKNQKETMKNYLKGVEERVEHTGKAQTKPLDGILVKIALEHLRERYPDKYVAIKSLRNGRKIVVVNPFKGEQNH
ncbi:MAG: hypothetical protein B6D59_05885 [Campylobacteraceae bacterium 4484_4]|nr:MAG: hypothetical protein B6D59_05885 [Campylobacteraceae bacterium 4484_4]